MDRRQLLGWLAAMGGSMAVSGLSVGLFEGDEQDDTRDQWRSSVGDQVLTGTLPVTWSALPPAGSRVALSFDDGPTLLFTPGLLDILDRTGIRATFFVIGALVELHPDLVKRAVDSGHEIANHTYDHFSAAVRTAGQVSDAVERGSEVIGQIAGSRPRWLRPPRGEITTATLAAAQQAGLDIALWSVDRGHVPDADSAGVAAHLRSSLHPGSVVDLHDGIGRSSWVGHPNAQLITRRRAELRALPSVLASWLDDGFEFQTLSELIPRAVDPARSPSTTQGA